MIGLFAFWNTPGSILVGIGALRGNLGKAQSPRAYFSMFLRARELALRKSSKCTKTTVFLRFSCVFNKSHAPRAGQKKAQHRPWSLSNGPIHKDRAKNSSWGSPGYIWEGSGAILGASWPSLGRLLATLEWFLIPPGRFLGATGLV